MAHQNLSDEELLRILEETPLDRAKRTDAYYFILEYGIKRGGFKIPTYLLYYKYLQWKPDQKKMIRQHFFRVFKLLFKPYRKGPNEKGYLLNMGNMIITDLDYFNARVQRRKDYGQKKGETK